MTPRTTESDRGIAIVAALWASAVLAVIILSVLQIVRADARVGRVREDVAQLNSAADAAINITILSMLGPAAMQPPVNAVPFTVPFAGYTARVTVQDETGKIDLNMAKEATLNQLLLGAGLGGGAAADITRKIIAWRGASPASQSGGGDTATSSHRQMFQSVEELQQLTGITPDIYRALAPLLTVYSQATFIDPSYSSLQVLSVFRTTDATAEQAWRRIEEERAGLRARQPSPGVALGHAFTITAEVNGPASARAVRTAVVRLTGQARDPLLIYRWN